MAVMAAALPYIAAAGTVLSAAGSINSGNQVAAQERAQGQAAQASGERAAYNQSRDTTYLQSRAKAFAAASGGSSSDPSVVTDMGQIGAEGSYRRLTALYSGDTSAAGDQMEASAAQSTGMARGVSTVLSEGSSLASKYWPTPPPSDGLTPIDTSWATGYLQ